MGINMSMELHKANLEAQNQAIAVASSHPTASAGLLPVASFLIPKVTMASTLSVTANTAVTTNTVNGGVMSTSTAASHSTASDQAQAAAALNPHLAYLLKPNVESNYYIPNPYVTAAPHA